MPQIPKNILGWWRMKLAEERERLADIEAGRVSADESTIRYLKFMIPRIEKNIEYAERINGDWT